MEPRDGDASLPFGRSPRCVSCGWCYECVICWAGQPAPECEVASCSVPHSVDGAEVVSRRELCAACCAVRALWCISNGCAARALPCAALRVLRVRCAARAVSCECGALHVRRAHLLRLASRRGSSVLIWNAGVRLYFSTGAPAYDFTALLLYVQFTSPNIFSLHTRPPATTLDPDTLELDVDRGGTAPRRAARPTAPRPRRSSPLHILIRLSSPRPLSCVPLLPPPARLIVCRGDRVRDRNADIITRLPRSRVCARVWSLSVISALRRACTACSAAAQSFGIRGGGWYPW